MRAELYAARRSAGALQKELDAVRGLATHELHHLAGLLLAMLTLIVHATGHSRAGSPARQAGWGHGSNQWA